jgi:hypothetical protein
MTSHMGCHHLAASFTLGRRHRGMVPLPLFRVPECYMHIPGRIWRMLSTALIMVANAKPHGVRPVVSRYLI